MPNMSEEPAVDVFGLEGKGGELGFFWNVNRIQNCMASQPRRQKSSL